MMLPRVGDEYPIGGRHNGHVARIVALDLHGIPSWEDDAFLPPPTIEVRCSCGAEFADDLIEAVIVPPLRRSSVA